MVVFYGPIYAFLPSLERLSATLVFPGQVHELCQKVVRSTLRRRRFASRDVIALRCNAFESYLQIMKPTDKSNKTASKIKLSKTFFQIEKGEVSASEVAAKKKAEKEAARAEIIKKGGIPDKTDPFMSNYNR